MFGEEGIVVCLNLGERLVGGQNHVNALEGPDAIAFSPRIDEKSADAAFAKLEAGLAKRCGASGGREAYPGQRA